MERFVKVSKVKMFMFCFKLDRNMTAYDGREKMIETFGAKTLYTNNGKYVYKLVKTDKRFKFTVKKLNKKI